MATTPSQGICLDAESIRAELDESPQSHDLTAEHVTKFRSLSDDELNVAINQEVDDDFWQQYDDVRRRAISRLVEQLGLIR